MMKLLVVALLSLTFALPAFGKTYKSTYPDPCSQVWGAVKDTLSNAERTTTSWRSDDAKMAASYNVKHSAHVNIAGAASSAPTTSPWCRRVRAVRCK